MPRKQLSAYGGSTLLSRLNLKKSNIELFVLIVFLFYCISAVGVFNNHVISYITKNIEYFIVTIL